MTAWWLSDDYLMTAWWLLDDCLMTAWWSTDDHLMTVWWPPDDHLMTAWWWYQQNGTTTKWKAKLFTRIWNWTVWWIFCYCFVHPSSVLELLRTLLSFSKSNVYFRPGFFFSWAVKHEHMFVGKREREKKAKKKYVQVPGFGQKMYYFTFNGIYFLTVIRFGSKIKCVRGQHRVLWRKLWSKMSKLT